MQHEARVGRQQALHHRRFVGGEVVADHVDGQGGVGLAVDLVWEVAEVYRSVLGGQLADDLAGGGVQRGGQVDGAVPHIVEAAPLGHPGIIASTGAVRSSAWICGFSSRLNTAAFVGRAKYRPTTSRILSISSGSGES
jgi:hypothetical protein